MERQTCRNADVKNSEKATANKQALKFVESVENTRLQVGKWGEELDMDRFVILVFLTAEEKRAFAQSHFGTPDVDYFDGDDVESISLKKR